jgi:hypothetical protein
VQQLIIDFLNILLKQLQVLPADSLQMILELQHDHIPLDLLQWEDPGLILSRQL